MVLVAVVELVLVELVVCKKEKKTHIRKYQTMFQDSILIY